MTRLAKVLVVEDEPKMSCLLEQALEESGFEVTVASNGREGLRLAEGHHVAVVDVMMPIVDGFTMVETLRRQGYTAPVLFLTARDGLEDLLMGLELGGDDYLVKPFRLAELVARLRSLLRRSQQQWGPLRLGDLILDRGKRTVQRGGRPLFLSETEFQLLETFMRRPGKVLSRAEVLREVWRGKTPQGENALEVYVHYLRSKLEAFNQPRILFTVKGQGYVLDTNEAEPY